VPLRASGCTQLHRTTTLELCSRKEGKGARLTSLSMLQTPGGENLPLHLIHPTQNPFAAPCPPTQIPPLDSPPLPCRTLGSKNQSASFLTVLLGRTPSTLPRKRWLTRSKRHMRATYMQGERRPCRPGVGGNEVRGGGGRGAGGAGGGGEVRDTTPPPFAATKPVQTKTHSCMYPPPHPCCHCSPSAPPPAPHRSAPPHPP
jgi:hypothetical protein